MLPSEFLSWLDKEIEGSIRAEINAEKDKDRGQVWYWRGWSTSLKAAKERFESLQYPPQPIDPEQNEINKFMAKD
jgi:hypothetical protein